MNHFGFLQLAYCYLILGGIVMLCILLRCAFSSKVGAEPKRLCRCLLFWVLFIPLYLFVWSYQLNQPGVLVGYTLPTVFDAWSQPVDQGWKELYYYGIFRYGGTVDADIAIKVGFVMPAIFAGLLFGKHVSAPNLSILQTLKALWKWTIPSAVIFTWCWLWRWKETLGDYLSNQYLMTSFTISCIVLPFYIMTGGAKGDREYAEFWRNAPIGTV